MQLALTRVCLLTTASVACFLSPGRHPSYISSDSGSARAIVSVVTSLVAAARAGDTASVAANVLPEAYEPDGLNSFATFVARASVFTEPLALKDQLLVDTVHNVVVADFVVRAQRCSIGPKPEHDTYQVHLRRVDETWRVVWAGFGIC